MRCKLCNKEAKNHPDGGKKIYCSQGCAEIVHIARSYNVSEEEAADLQSRKRQLKCEYCGDSVKKYRAMNIEHCHKTGKVRGVACRSCNSMIGAIESNKKCYPKECHLVWISKG